MSADARLAQLGITLPAPNSPIANYVGAVQVGNLLFVSGTGPSKADGSSIVGQLGKDMDVKQGQEAARLVGINVLAAVKKHVGSLDKVERVVKTLGMVNATADFKDHPKVINGFSDLMVEVFGPEKGKGARSAVGMASLPGGIPVEVEIIFQIRK